MGANRKEIWEWREWLHARNGRWSKFYMSSWSVDFEPLEDIGAADESVTVVDVQYRNFYETQAGKRDIVIDTVNNGKFYRRITSAAVGSPGE